MATTYGTQMAKTQTSPPGKIDVTYNGASVRAFVESVTLAGQAIGAAVIVGTVPAGSKLLGFVVNPSVSLGTATLLFATTGGTVLAAAKTFTAANTPTLTGNTGIAQLSADTDIQVTVGSAALPASGTVEIVTLYTAQ